VGAISALDFEAGQAESRLMDTRFKPIQDTRLEQPHSTPLDERQVMAGTPVCRPLQVAAELADPIGWRFV
jgi:hypothetical protein